MAFSSYRDTDIYDIDDSDSEYDSDDGPDLMEPSSRSPSPYKGSVKPSSWIPRARALSLEPDLDLSKLSSSNGKTSSRTPPPPEKPKSKAMHTIGARISALLLWYHKHNTDEIKAITGIGKSTLSRLKDRALSRGWTEGAVPETWHVEDAPRSGRPSIKAETVELIIQTVTKNSTTRQWSCARIAAEVSKTEGAETVSPSTVYRTLRSEGYGVYKRTIKPGLTKEMKERRLKWCKERAWMTLEDWKYVIFSDETSVVISGVRGKRRV